MAVEAPHRTPPEPSAEEQARAMAAARETDKPEKLTEADEVGALHYLLGGRAPTVHTVEAQYMTPEGRKPIKFEIRATDGRKIDKIEQANVSDTTGQVDQITANCQIVAEACISIVDETGEKTDPKSVEFRTVNPEAGPLASTADALEVRFRDQLGLIAGVAREVRRIGGWDPEAVGKAQRKLVEAAGNS